MSALSTTMLGKLGGTKVLKKAAPAKKTTTEKKGFTMPTLPKTLSSPKKTVSSPKKTVSSPKKTIFSPKKTVSAPKPVKAVKKVAKKAKSAVAAGARAGGVGYRRFDGRKLWLPNAEVPEWLDGSLPGDRGFDPLGLAKPVEYLQVDVDQLDQNKDSNKMGGIVGSFSPVVDQVSEDRLQPYSEVFGLARFRECELIHGRWCMLATLGCIVAEANTGVSWVDAGKVELDGATYFGFDLPFSITQLVWIEALAVGGAELYRNTTLDPEKRCYPGGYFDPLNLASDPERAFRLKEAEIKHARLAMVAFFGFGVQALATGEGVLGSLAKFSETL